MDTQALEKLEQAFGQWRAGRKSKHERVPRALIAQARELAASVPERVIARRTGMARRRLFPKAPTAPVKFVELPSPVLSPAPATSPAIQIEFKNRDYTITISAPSSANFENLLTALRRT